MTKQRLSTAKRLIEKVDIPSLVCIGRFRNSALSSYIILLGKLKLNVPKQRALSDRNAVRNMVYRYEVAEVIRTAESVLVDQGSVMAVLDLLRDLIKN